MYRFRKAVGRFSCTRRRPGLWVPAFAGTTRNCFHSTKKAARPDRLSVTHMSPSAAAAADHGADGIVRPEILGAVDIEQGAEFRARAVDAALDSANRAAADRRCVLIGK